MDLIAAATALAAVVAVVVAVVVAMAGMAVVVVVAVVLMPRLTAGEAPFPFRLYIFPGQSGPCLINSKSTEKSMVSRQYLSQC